MSATPIYRNPIAPDTFTPGDLAVLEARAITPEYAASLGMHSVDLDALRTLRSKYSNSGWESPYGRMPLPEGVSGLMMPYDAVWTPYDQTDRYRLRASERTHLNSDGERVPNERYYASAGSSVIVYWTHGCKAIAGDVTKPIWATEAPMKAGSLDCNGFPAFGMGGVMAGVHDVAEKEISGDLVPGPDFQRVEWKGRRLYITYDASITHPSKPLVSLGAAYLAVCAQRAGAEVWLVRIPLLPTSKDSDLDGNKFYSDTDQGPDDFIAQRGVDAFCALMADPVACHPIDPTERLRLQHPNATQKEIKEQGLGLLDDIPTLAYLRTNPLAVQKLATYSGVSARVITDAVARYSARLAPKAKTEETTSRYTVTDNGFTVDTKEGLVPISNFTAVIEKVVAVVGANGTTEERWILRGQLRGREVGPIEVEPEAFHKCEPWWTGFGPEAKIVAGKGTKEMVREAIQDYSTNIPRDRMYEHTGWVQDGDSWVYLHANGAIGGTNKQVQLKEQFSHYRFTEPLERKPDWDLLRVVSLRIGLTLFAYNRLAVLSSILNPRLSVWLVAPTTYGKTELAKLFNCEFGDFGSVPPAQSFVSTPTSIERAMNRCKDTLLVIDDFCPKGTDKEAAIQRAVAETVIRSAGNRQSRGRAMNTAEERKNYPPQGVTLCTAETDPVGDTGASSLSARMLKFHVQREDVKWDAVTAVQTALARDPFALSHDMRGFIEWLAPRYGNLLVTLPRERDVLRASLRTEYGDGLGARQPDIVADLAIALRVYMRYLVDTGYDVVPPWEDDLVQSLLATATEQHQKDDLHTPEMIYLRTLEAILGNRTATLAPSESCMGERDIGWYQGDTACLVTPLMDRAVAQHLRQSGTSIALPSADVYTAMHRRGWTTPDGKYVMHRRTEQGKRLRTVLWIPFANFEIQIADLIKVNEDGKEGAGLGGISDEDIRDIKLGDQLIQSHADKLN